MGKGQKIFSTSGMRGIHMKKIFPVKKAEKKEPGMRRGRFYRILSVPVCVMELAAALLFMICSLFFICYGYEDYLMNRNWIVPAGCLLAVAILQFLVGETILHRYTALRWRTVIHEAGVWMICLMAAEAALRWRASVYESSVWKTIWVIMPEVTFSESLDDYLSALEYFSTAVFLVVLLYLVICLFSLCSKYGKKSCLYVLVMVTLEMFELKTGVDSGKVSLSASVVLLLLSAVSFCAGAFRQLLSGWIGKKRETGRKQILLKRAAMIALAGGILFWLGMYAPENAPEIKPRQDEEGYYLLCTRESFEWFIHRINMKNEEHNVNARLTADIVLNDTSNWENWAEEAPEYQYKYMWHYSGHFDGNGHALEGYYSAYEAPVFSTLEKEALVTDLKIRKSLFQSTYEESSYVNDDGEVDVISAAALCNYNKGRIEGCDVEAAVIGDWSAGGIVGMNYGVVEDCRFAGKVEAGRVFGADFEDNSWAGHRICAGGICEINHEGSIQNCFNEGEISCETVSDTYYMSYVAGGIAGQICEEGSTENCKNTGDIQGPEFSGGIAGASRGEIYQCENTGKVHVEQTGPGHRNALITAGICASNGGLVDSCWNTGEMSIRQDSLSDYASVYGIACNLANYGRGQTKNCYYLPEKAKQDYRQSGVYKLSAAQMAEVEKYVASGQSAVEKAADEYTASGQDMTKAGEKNDTSDTYLISDVDSWELFSEFPDFPGTDEDDYIHLHVGPTEDMTYEVQPGDTLWKIAESFYGDRNCYDSLVCPGDSADHFAGSDLIQPGKEVFVPALDYYLLCTNDEEGFAWSFGRDASGEKCPNTYFMAKPGDWCYGLMTFVANRGLDVLWPADQEAGNLAAAGDIRILYCIDGNPEGDFLAGEWESAKEKITESAGIYCGQGMEDLQFYRYELDGGEFLYGYSFRLYPDRCPFESELRKGMDETSPGDEALNCAVFYRLREGLLVEFIGIEPAEEDMDVLARTRYLVARVVDGPALEEKNTGEEFYGRENWPYTKLHNPFAVALEYSPEKGCLYGTHWGVVGDL